MTQTILLSSLFFGLAVLMMSLGVIIQGKKLKGSCGGLENLLGPKCLFCSKSKECPAKTSFRDN